MLVKARCFDCDWGLTGEEAAVKESSEAHVDEGCPGPVLVIDPYGPWQGKLTIERMVRFVVRKVTKVA